MQKNTVTTEFIERFRALEGMVASVHIKHILYGNQKIKRCILHPIVDGERVGLHINDEDVYITTSELLDIRVSNNEHAIRSDVMELCVNL